MNYDDEIVLDNTITVVKPKEEEKLTFLACFNRDYEKFKKLILSKRMLYLLPEISWTGVSLAIYTGLLVPMIVQTLPNESHNEQLKKAMFCMTALGVGEIVGGLIIGIVIDQLGNRYASWASLIAVITQTLVLCSFLVHNEYGTLAFLASFVWGVQDSIVNTHLNQILGFEFKDHVFPYSVFNFVQCFTVFVFMFIESQLPLHINQEVLFISFAGLLGLVMCSFVLKFPYKANAKTKEDNNIHSIIE